jgi:ABC-type Zn uptake system ZnuABC Zn-binding protein ZnuA
LPGLLAVFAIGSLSVGGCQPAPAAPGLVPIAELQPAALRADETLRVAVTTSILADVVSQVGGDTIILTTLLPFGSEPHSYEPTPQDRRMIEEAHVVLMNGLGLEPFLESQSLLAEIPAPVVALSEGIIPLVGGEDSEEGPDAPDPHVWLDPAHVIRWTDNAVQALAALDPAHEEAYRERAAAYRAELQALDARLVDLVEQLPPARRKLVTDHEAFGYFAARFGFEIIGAVIPSPSGSAETSAQALAELEDAIRTEAVPAVFVSEAVSRDLAQRVAEDTGARLVTLYLESLTGPQGPAPSYIALMDYNVAAIVDALLR